MIPLPSEKRNPKSLKRNVAPNLSLYRSQSSCFLPSYSGFASFKLLIRNFPDLSAWADTMPGTSLKFNNECGSLVAHTGTAQNLWNIAGAWSLPTNRITGILNGQRAVTGDTALRLGHFFGSSAEFWLNLQSLYELRLAEQKLGKSIMILPTLKKHGPARP